MDYFWIDGCYHRLSGQIEPHEITARHAQKMSIFFTIGYE
jgi:hypothetical protein